MTIAPEAQETAEAVLVADGVGKRFEGITALSEVSLYPTQAYSRSSI